MLWTVNSLQLIIIASLESLLHKRWQSHSDHVTAFGLSLLPRGNLSLLIAIHFTCDENHMKTVSPTHWSNTGIGICGSRWFKSWHTGKTWGNIEQGRANHRTGCTTWSAKIRIACSSLSKSLLHICWIDVFFTWAWGVTSRNISQVSPGPVSSLSAWCYVLHGRVSTRGGTRFSLTLLQRSETFVAHPRVHTFHTRPCRSKRLAPIRHSWTCRASLSRQHYTMNMSDLHCLWLTFQSNIFALLLSNMSGHVYNNSLSDLWEFNFWSSASACVIVCPCVHRVENIESSSAKALKFQLPFMGQCQNLHPQQVPVPNLTTSDHYPIVYLLCRCLGSFGLGNMNCQQDEVISQNMSKHIQSMNQITAHTGAISHASQIAAKELVASPEASRWCGVENSGPIQELQ